MAAEEEKKGSKRKAALKVRACKCKGGCSLLEKCPETQN
jgi:hypothetical protein